MMLLDSSVLIRVAGPHDARRDRAWAAIDRLKYENIPSTVCPQVIAEFWAVATRSIDQRGGLNLTIAEAKNWVDRFTNVLFHFIWELRSCFS